MQECKKTLIPLLKDAQQKRSKIIHSSWGFSPSSGKVFRVQISARGVYKLSSAEVKIADLDEAIETIDRTSDAIYDLASDAWQRDILREKLRTRGKNETPQS
jgi:hypothetical protein